MSTVLILGQSNVGKSLFMISLLESYGYKSILLDQTGGGALAPRIELTIDQAVKTLTGPELNMTKGIHTVEARLPVRKGRRICEILDTTGLSERIHPDTIIRLGMAATLRKLRHADLVFHLVDAERVATDGLKRAFSEIDYQVMQYCTFNCGYALVANKMDLPGASKGLRLLEAEFPRLQILPVSALRREGFEEIRRFINEHL